LTWCSLVHSLTASSMAILFHSTFSLLCNGKDRRPFAGLLAYKHAHSAVNLSYHIRCCLVSKLQSESSN
jgi:hypothetical protein